jgi:hypothetical protein
MATVHTTPSTINALIAQQPTEVERLAYLDVSVHDVVVVEKLQAHQNLHYVSVAKM